LTSYLGNQTKINGSSGRFKLQLVVNENYTVVEYHNLSESVKQAHLLEGGL
jgi:hypothetical protein